MNKVLLTGRIATMIECRYTTSGIAFSAFRVAVNRPFVRQEGAENADFIDCVAWRQQAEFAERYLLKGRLVEVEGRLQTRSYTDNAGIKRRITEVVIDQIKALDSPKKTEPETVTVGDETVDDASRAEADADLLAAAGAMAGAGAG